MPVTIDIEVRNEKLLDQISDGITEHAAPVIAKQAISALQSPGSSWPVDTGLSKAGFSTRITSSRKDIQINNSQDYATDVESRTAAAFSTLDRNGALGGDDAAREIVKRIRV